MSFWSALFGRRAEPAKAADPVEYKGFVIRAAPYKNDAPIKAPSAESMVPAPPPFSMMTSPRTRMMADRRKTLSANACLEAPRARCALKEKIIATPTANKNKGKTMSANVQPYHSAWRKGA